MLDMTVVQSMSLCIEFYGVIHRQKPSYCSLGSALMTRIYIIIELFN